MRLTTLEYIDVKDRGLFRGRRRLVSRYVEDGEEPRRPYTVESLRDVRVTVRETIQTRRETVGGRVGDGTGPRVTTSTTWSQALPTTPSDTRSTQGRSPVWVERGRLWGNKMGRSMVVERTWRMGPVQQVRSVTV